MKKPTTATTQRLINAYNLSPEVIVMCYAIAAGCPPSDAYIYTHPNKSTTEEEAQNLAQMELDKQPGAKLLISRLKMGRAKPIQTEEEIKDLTEEERDEFCTKEGLTRKIVTALRNTSGKDKIAGLVTLAKLQGLDKIEEESEEERRRYFLPWVSACRNCQLMAIYRSICAMPDK